MGAQGAANIVYRRELAAIADPDEQAVRRQELIGEYEEALLNPYGAAERGYVDQIIPPSQTRLQVTKALRMLQGKRETLPPKKHGNIPL
jgi:propionyl-CoA carboxylase beta chain